MSKTPRQLADEYEDKWAEDGNTWTVREAIEAAVRARDAEVRRETIEETLRSYSKALLDAVAEHESFEVREALKSMITVEFRRALGGKTR